MLIENTLFGKRDLVELAIMRFKEFESQAVDMNSEGYWLAFSGGKDSVVILDLAKKARVKFSAHFNVTTVDSPELLRFIRDTYSRREVKWEKPTTTMSRLIVKNRSFPLDNRRFCCAELKERGGEDSFVATGVRWKESGRRTKRRMTEVCFKNSRKRFLHPIIEWTDKDVWEYIKKNNLPYCELYDQGFDRVGCVGCGCGSIEQRSRQFERWPRIKKMYVKAGNEMVAAFKSVAPWETGEEAFNWWMNDKTTIKNDPDQGVLFE